MTKHITITMEEEELKDLCHHVEHNGLYRAVVTALGGRSLEELEKYFDEWSQHYPIIDAELTLTGGWEYADAGNRDLVNYDDRAMISIEDAREGGWEIDDGNGAANPVRKGEHETYSASRQAA